MPNINHQIRINTRILDGKGLVLPVKIINDDYSYKIKYKNIEIGCIEYTVKPDCIYINRMYNHTINTEHSIKHVGTALFECAFKTSLALGKGGHIELLSVEESSIAYYKMGLRKQSSAYMLLEKEINNYNTAKNTINKNNIETSKYFNLLKEEAINYKNIVDHSKYLTFEEIIEYGRYSSDNDKFGSLFTNNDPLTWIDCYTYGMQSYMYLPQNSIDNNINKFGEYMFCPIGSNFTGSYLLSQGYLCTQLADDRLIKLVQDKVIDPANAIEISVKYGSLTTEQIDLILSPVGLELMSRNYISAWYMMVYLKHKLEVMVSEKTLHAFEDGTITHINDYVEHPYLFEQLLGETQNL